LEGAIRKACAPESSHILIALVIAALGAGALPATVTANEPAAVLLAAGDIGDCQLHGGVGARMTAKILGGLDGTIAALGDLVYPAGGADGYRDCYGVTWGVYKDRTRPVPGNHEYYDGTGTAGPYFDYWGATAGDRWKGYYSYDLGSWHIVALNSNCVRVDCWIGSLQERWLQSDLAAHPARCTLAYWHHPLFSSGRNPGHARTEAMRPIWRDLYRAGATLVLNGHEHFYERFAPQDPDGKPDPLGIREFVVGTGGGAAKKYTATPFRNSEIRHTGEFGVLKLVLHEDSYDWEFVGDPAGSFHDAGTGTCHPQQTAGPVSQ
jgi:calcineurin-like phosphoesterase family protein